MSALSELEHRPGVQIRAGWKWGRPQPRPNASWARDVAMGAVVAGAVSAGFVRFGLTGTGALAGFFLSVLVVLSAIDLRERRLPNRIVVPSAAVVLAAQVALHPDRTIEWIASAFGASALLLVAAIAYPGGLGMGDVKLALMLGAMLGTSVASALLLGCFAAGGFGLLLIATQGVAARKTALPFGPFLALGAAVTLLAGPILNLG